MRGRLLALWSEVHDSFWPVPAVMVLAAMVLAELVVDVDERVTLSAWRGLGWVYGGSADGARSMLAAIASSVIGVAGTTFSITIAALTLASSQMGPRLLAHFTRDRGNQAALGAFLATFAYALLVLRTVRGGERAFVPHLAVTLGLALAFASLGVLIYFIHHIAASINVGQVIRLIARDLERTVAEQFPPRASGANVPPSLPPDFEARARPIYASSGGYLQSLDVAALVRLAERGDAVVRLAVRPGDFVFPGMEVARACPALDGVEGGLVLGPRRTGAQDVEFAVQQLVEVAVRALSPGINDPFTAVAVLDYLGGVLCRVSERELPSPHHCLNGQLRLIVPVTDFGGLTDAMFHQIRQNGAKHPAVMIRLLEVLTQAVARFEVPERRAALARHAELACCAGVREARADEDKRDLEERHRRFLGSLNTPSAGRRADAAS